MDLIAKAAGISLGGPTEQRQRARANTERQGRIVIKLHLNGEPLAMEEPVRKIDINLRRSNDMRRLRSNRAIRLRPNNLGIRHHLNSTTKRPRSSVVEEITVAVVKGEGTEAGDILRAVHNHRQAAAMRGIIGREPRPTTLLLTGLTPRYCLDEAPAHAFRRPVNVMLPQNAVPAPHRARP